MYVVIAQNRELLDLFIVITYRGQNKLISLLFTYYLERIVFDKTGISREFARGGGI